MNYLELPESENMRYQNLWDADKAVFMEKFTVLNDYIRKEEWYQNNINFYFKKLENKHEIETEVKQITK